MVFEFIWFYWGLREESLQSLCIDGAEGETRTRTSVRSLDPEPKFTSKLPQ